MSPQTVFVFLFFAKWSKEIINDITINNFDIVNQNISYQSNSIQIDLRFGNNHFLLTSETQNVGAFQILKNGTILNYEKSAVHGFVNPLTEKFEGILHLNDTFSIFIEPANVVGLQSKLTIAYNQTSIKVQSPTRTCGLTENYNRTRSRFPRAVLKRIPFPGNRSTCSLFIRTDVEFYKYFYDQYGNKNHDSTIDYITALIDLQVKELNRVYSGVEFKTSKGILTGFNFQIKRLKIMEPKDCEDVSKRATRLDPGKLLCKTFPTLYDYRRELSRQDFSDYCLAYGFTGQSEERLLGLSILGHKERGHGVCGTRISGLSKNVGLISLKAVKPQIIGISLLELTLTFAHEIGHSLGAVHDIPNTDCAPGEPNGNYLMYEASFGGLYPNNFKFSKCSAETISDFIEWVLLEVPNCLVAWSDSTCGNRIVESSEDCDCGYEDECVQQNDKCCYPADYPYVKLRCKLRKNALCSPSMGSCCSTNCKFKSRNEICEISFDECRLNGHCNGKSAKCSQRTSRDFSDGTLCNDDEATCLNGQCIGSICAHFGLKSCLPESVDIRSATVQERLKLCHVHCILDGQCVDTAEFKDSMELCKKSLLNCSQGFMLSKGSVCSQQGAACEAFQMCILTDHKRALTVLDRNANFRITAWALSIVGILIAVIKSAFLIMLCTRKLHANMSPNKVEPISK
ncbi:hypothetical protein ACOME3_000264 [Neoechinorhynchus agilis]